MIENPKSLFYSIFNAITNLNLLQNKKKETSGELLPCYIYQFE